MKKWVCLLGMVVCFLFGTTSAHADIIWEPFNDFYEKHSDECTYVNREYTANGPDGVVILYESPESAKEVATWKNGYQTWISYTYEDEQGVVWGYPYGSSAKSDDGWMPMEYMTLVYDSISFVEEHGEEIEIKDGVLDESYKDETIYFWKYPGSDESAVINMREMGAYAPEELNMPAYNSVYTDNEGHSWGHIGYYYGDSDVWICLDNPTAEYEELYPNGAPQFEVRDNEKIQEGEKQSGENQTAKDGESQSEENQNMERITPKTNTSIIVVVIVLVAAVVLITIILLVMLKKRKV